MGDEAAEVDRTELAGVRATDPGLCWLKATKDAVGRSLVTGTRKMNIAALASGGSLAYRAQLRPVDDEGTAYECGAYGHGPHAAQLAGRLVGHIRTWDRDHRAGPGPGCDLEPGVGVLPAPGAPFR